MATVTVLAEAPPAAAPPKVRDKLIGLDAPVPLLLTLVAEPPLPPPPPTDWAKIAEELSALIPLVPTPVAILLPEVTATMPPVPPVPLGFLTS